MKFEHGLGTVLLVGLLFRAGAAHACTWEPVVLYHSDPALAQSDTLAPSQPVVMNVDVTRRSGLTCGQERCVQNSCGDTGMVSIELSPGEDDQTPSERLGYRIERMGGNVPDSLRNLIGVNLAARSPIYLRIGFDEVAALDATLQVIAIDAAGNESAPSDPFVVAFDGCTLAAVGEQCESQFNPDTDLTSPGVTSAIVSHEVEPRLSSCALGARTEASSAFAALLAVLGFAAYRRQTRLSS